MSTRAGTSSAGDQGSNGGERDSVGRELRPNGGERGASDSGRGQRERASNSSNAVESHDRERQTPPSKRTAANGAQVSKRRFNPWAVAVVVSMATFMEVL